MDKYDQLENEVYNVRNLVEEKLKNNDSAPFLHAKGLHETIKYWEAVVKKDNVLLLQWMLGTISQHNYIARKVEKLRKDWEFDILLADSVEDHFRCVEIFFESKAIQFSKTDVMEKAIQLKDIAKVRKLSILGANYDESCMMEAVDAQSMEILSYLRDKGCKWDDGCVMRACMSGNFDIFKWCVDKKCPLSDDAFDSAVAAGREFVDYLVERNCPMGSSAFSYAKDPEMTLYLIELGCELDSDATNKAVSNGNIEMVKLLRGTHNCDWDEYVLEEAVGSGNLEMLKYCLAEGCELSEDATLTACKKGNLEFLQILLDAGVKLEEDCLEDAARYGRLNIVQYLLSNKLASFKKSVLTRAFAGGDKEVLSYLFETQNITPSSDHLKKAVDGNKTDSLQFLIDRGVEIDNSIALYTAAEGSVPMFQLIEKTGCEINYSSCLMKAESKNNGSPLHEYLQEVHSERGGNVLADANFDDLDLEDMAYGLDDLDLDLFDLDDLDLNLDDLDLDF